jgi:predicted TIM-barrel fold metal-dependent hydrolase
MPTIIDAHLHLNKKSVETDFSAAIERLNTTLDNNGVHQAAIIADDIKNGDCIDTWELLKYPELKKRYYLIGSPNILDMQAGDWQFFADNLKNKNLIALKLFPGHEPFVATDKRCNKVYQLALKHHVPVVFHTGANSNDLKPLEYNDPRYMVQIAQQNPTLKIVIAHYFWPQIDYCFDLTVHIPNIYYDISALADPEVTQACGGIPKVKDILMKTIQVKPSSVMFGSDYDMCDQKTHLDLINSLKISTSAKHDILGRNFGRCYNLVVNTKITS